MTDSPRLYIYSEKRNQRLAYAANELLRRRLGIEFSITGEYDSFMGYEGLRLNYSNVEIEGIPTIKPAKILFEKRIQEQELNIDSADGFKLFAHQNTPLGFDPLAATFYLLSRYEEYLPHIKDEHDRFPSEEAVVVKHKVEQEPLVEQYAKLLGDWLLSMYPHLQVNQSKFILEITVDVDQLFALKSKGLTRSIIGTTADVARGRGAKRLAVLTGRKNDPNEIYDDLIIKCSKKGIKPRFFFQVGENSRYDINNPPHLSAVKERINDISLSAHVGIHPSYYSSDQDAIIDMEVSRLRAILTLPIRESRQHYLRYKLPDTFRQLSEHGVHSDYSLGFVDRNGFRASTCKPFRMYDLQREEVIEITMFPMSTMDTASQRSHHDPEQALEEMLRIKRSIHSFGGVMVTTWHPEVLAGTYGDYPTFPLLEEFLGHV